jgi:NarL family two-component system response regulator YdfI
MPVPVPTSVHVILVGTPEQRARLRRAIQTDMVSIVGEGTNVAAARTAANGQRVDAVLSANGGADVSTHDDDAGPLVEALTPREVDVLEWVAAGLPNKAIAARLGISDQTVKFHISAIYAKLNAHNRTDAVRIGVRLGLISL